MHPRKKIPKMKQLYHLRAMPFPQDTVPPASTLSLPGSSLAADFGGTLLLLEVSQLDPSYEYII